MSEGKILIKQTNMSEDMQQDAVDSVTQAMEKHKVPMEIAAFVKKDFDKKYNPTWHCIVGKNFGSYVNYETQGLIYLFVGQVAILLYRFSWGALSVETFFSLHRNEECTYGDFVSY